MIYKLCVVCIVTWTKKNRVHRLVTDNSLARKIHDREMSKQGIAERVVDQCSPDAHFSFKKATTLFWNRKKMIKFKKFYHAKIK